jgi:hypothetical protein
VSGRGAGISGQPTHLFSVSQAINTCGAVDELARQKRTPAWARALRRPPRIIGAINPLAGVPTSGQWAFVRLAPFLLPPRSDLPLAVLPARDGSNTWRGVSVKVCVPTLRDHGPARASPQQANSLTRSLDDASLIIIGMCGLLAAPSLPALFLRLIRIPQQPPPAARRLL